MKKTTVFSLAIALLASSTFAFAGGSSVGITETNPEDKLLIAGESDQLLMGFSLEPWASIPGDLKLTTLDLHCTPGEGFTTLTLQADAPVATSEFVTDEAGKMRAHFEAVDFVIPNGEVTELQLLVDVAENTGDFISTCALDDLTFLNLESNTEYEAGRYNFDFNLNQVVYVDDPQVDLQVESPVNFLGATFNDTPLTSDSQDNPLLEFEMEASSPTQLDSLFFYCESASELKDVNLMVDGVEIQPSDIQVDWMTASRPEHSSDKRLIFSDLNFALDEIPTTFNLTGDTYDYFSNLTGPSCRLINGVVTDLETDGTALLPETIRQTPYYIAAPVPFENPYSDVEESNPYFPAIRYLSENDVLQGYPDGTFQPLKTLNRAELLKILVTGNGAFPTLEGGYEFCFPDVAQEWFAPYICYAKAQNWVEGYPDGNFYPANDVIKAEAIKILVNSQNYPIPTVYPGDVLFDDTDKTHWYAPFVKAAKERGLLEERETYGIGEKINRGQISENIYRAMVIAEEGLGYYSNPQRGALAYDNPTLGFGFLYPNDWDVVLGDGEKVVLKSPKRYDMNYKLQITLLAESFEVYEAEHQQQITDGQMSISEIERVFEGQTYLTKRYDQHGGTIHLIKLEDTYVKILTEDFFSPQQKEEIGLILNSFAMAVPQPVASTMCSIDTYNCSDFLTQAEAQSTFDECMSAVGNDIHKLDGDNNSVACESTF